MKKLDVSVIAAQLNIKAKNANDLADIIESMNMIIAIENTTGDWIILNDTDDVVARCA